MIPFAPPHIDNDTLEAVVKVLKSGWITTGPVTKQFEKDITTYCNCKATLCLNSATAGLEIMLRWFGVGPGDEVILPAYTYSATANVVMHVGAKPVFVDVNPTDFNINIKAIDAAITANTKIIMPVDFGGYPCDYNAIKNLVAQKANMFVAKSDNQQKLARILILSDAAHSFGASIAGIKTGSLADVSVFSFHAVKNLTTAEGGAIALNLPEPFDNDAIYKFLAIYTLHGQNKDALAKMQKGNWRYDIVEAGFKCNLTDINASIGAVGLKKYESQTLPKRKAICKFYNEALSKYNWAVLPTQQLADIESSYHLYPLRIKNINEAQRDLIIQKIFDADVSVNVHFIPLPMLSYYKNLGYDINHYPNTYQNYASEISLPVFFDITEAQLTSVINAVVNAVTEILKLD
ncbi:MAG: DegT/DnrJ/EryC1/StrS aminotransferase family protein [Bacteroidia bacterium]|nr:DegT/DnrJ/EryC1/StrS aminotransferase family protein [Bacteroidia bacterium]